jgi:ribosomal protein S18 acetylase RimI-like enzyme
LESNVQFRKAWSHFASHSPTGEVVDTPEVYIASANTPWVVLNASFLPKPVETEAELERSVAAAVRHFASHTTGWMYIACDAWLTPELHAKAPALFAAYGLRRTLVSMGMVAERIPPPTRLLASIDIRQATSDETLRHIADINALAYSAPLEAARASVMPAMFQGDCRGYVGYVQGKAVSVAALLRVDGVAYVAYVATRAEYRRLGYSEAVMRHALEEARQHWGLERTVLHATEEGRFLYLRMGYEDVATFGYYMRASEP